MLLEHWASKDELFAFRAEASKEKKALEEAFDVGFDVIFNYGYGRCAFEHNICGSKLGSQTRYLTRQSHYLQSSLLILDALPGIVPVEATIALEARISEGVEHSSTIRAKVGDNPDSLSR